MAESSDETIGSQCREALSRLAPMEQARLGARVGKSGGRKKHAPIRVNGKPRETSSREKTEVAAECLLKWPESPYRAAGAFATRFGCTRRTAQNFLEKARKDLVGRHPAVMKDLGVAIAHRYAEGLRLAMATCDVRGLARLLDGARKLVCDANVPFEQTTLTGIDFTVVDPVSGQRDASDPEAQQDMAEDGA